MKAYPLNSLKVLLVLVLVSTVFWQSCEPPPTPACAGNALFSTSAAFTFNPVNQVIGLRVAPAQTCALDVINEYYCESAFMGFQIQALDCYGNEESQTIPVLVNNTDHSVGGLNWEIDDTGGTVLNDGSILFVLPAFSLASIELLNISFVTDIVDDLACKTSPKQNSTFFFNSLAFHAFNGTPTPDETTLLESEAMATGSNYLWTPYDKTDDCR